MLKIFTTTKNKTGDHFWLKTSGKKTSKPFSAAKTNLGLFLVSSTM